jgi:PIN domain nuclease of toxin-antitoxin system
VIIFDDTKALTPRAIELFQSVENDLYLSTASALEIAIKYRSKRLVLAEAA